MDAQQQRLEIESVRADDDDLAVDDAAFGKRSRQRRDELREVPIHRLLVAALQHDLIAISKNQRAKAIPLGFELPSIANGQRVGGGRQHGLEGRLKRETHGELEISD